MTRATAVPTGLAVLALLAVLPSRAEEPAGTRPPDPAQAPAPAQPNAQAPELPPATGTTPPPRPVRPPPPAASGDDARRWSVSAVVGAGAINGEGYFILGANVGYEVALGLVVNVDAQWWAGQPANLGKVAPGITWYAPIALHPYLGAYYAHWFVTSDQPDQNALGGRAGVAMLSQGPGMVTFGVAYEHLLSCAVECDTWWPEVTAGVRF